MGEISAASPFFDFFNGPTATYFWAALYWAAYYGGRTRTIRLLAYLTGIPVVEEVSPGKTIDRLVCPSQGLVSGA